MGVFSFLFGSRVKPPVAEERTEPQAVSVAIGPSPWAFHNHSVVVGGSTYNFRYTPPGESELAGMSSIQDGDGTPLLILDFYCYARVLNTGAVLLWRESRTKDDRLIVFDCFDLSSLQPVCDPRATGAEMRARGTGAAPLPSSEHWEFSPHLEGGVHSFSLPYDWSRFGETLVLADYGDANGGGGMARAIFAFDWVKRQVEVFPQDWFNTGDYDFGYQWITRVARRTDGTIVGDGIRLGCFELDETNRRVKEWSVTDHFYMIQ